MLGNILFGFCSCLIVVFFCVCGLFLSYSDLFSVEHKVNTCWEQVDVQLRRRADLMPGLVSLIKGYTGHEAKVFDDALAVRNHLLQCKTVSERNQADVIMKDVADRLLAISEYYPDLAADDSFKHFREELLNSENLLALARYNYNSSVDVFNYKVKKFPYSWLSKVAGFGNHEYYVVDSRYKNVSVMLTK